MTKVWIGEEHDGFEIRIRDGNTEKSYRVNQEDSIELLVPMFEDLGFDVLYEEVY